MHRIRCIAVSAEGGFKINGPPKNGKGPMPSKEVSDTNIEASPSRPTQAGRIKTCTELIKQAMKCLENNDRECVMKLIEELVRNKCHSGYVVGREIANKVKDVVHDLWLVSDNECRCELLIMLRDLDISRGWVKKALGMNTKTLNMWLTKCGIDWERKIMRNDVVKEIEDLLRERFGWDEVRMCEELFRFIGIDVNAFRRLGIEPCVWLNDLEKLSDLRRPYWFGLRASDLTVREFDDNDYKIRLEIDTTGSVDAVFFPTLLNTVKTPSLVIKWERGAPAAKYVQKQIALSYYVDLGIDKWPWPELSADELERILNSLSNEELAEFLGGVIDGDGTVRFEYKSENGRFRYKGVFVLIAACKACPKRINLDVLREIIVRRFGIVGSIYSDRTADVLSFYGENAVRLLRLIRPFVHHPLRRLRIELLLAYYDGRISHEAFEELYKMTEYKLGGPDVKHNHGLEAIIRAAPQTHTHGEQTTHKRN